MVIVGHSIRQRRLRDMCAPAWLQRSSGVPRFHLNIYDGIQITDRAGIDLPSLTYAPREATRYAGALFWGGASNGHLGRDWR